MKTTDLTSVRKLKREDVVPYYKQLIKDEDNDDEVFRVNKLILSKWSSSGLEHIKKKAWDGTKKILITLKNK